MSAMPMAAAGLVSSVEGEGDGDSAGCGCSSFAQPGKPSDGMTVKLLLHLGQVALGPMLAWGAERHQCGSRGKWK